MKIALVHDWLTGMRGGEKILELFCELFPSADIFTLLHVQGSVSAKIEKHKIVTSFLQKLPFAKKWYRHYLPLMPQAIESLNLSGYELVISSSHCVAKGCLPPKGAVHISYCHTPMRYIWDQYENYFGKSRASPLVRVGMNAIRGWLQRWDKKSAERVDEFIANSHFVAKRIQDYYGRSSTVIHPFVDTDFFSPSPQSSSPRGEGAGEGGYYLIVSALAPYKRIELAVETFNRSTKKLKIIGSGQWEKRLKKQAKANIEFLGWVSDEKLRLSYQHCRALIFPGVEDFGMTPLEAMACGKPVVAFKEGGVTESVVEGRTALFFSEQTVESLQQAVSILEKNQWDPVLIRQQALKFSKRNFRDQFVSLLLRKVPKIASQISIS